MPYKKVQSKKVPDSRQVVARISTGNGGARLVIEESRADRWLKWGWRVGISLAAIATGMWWLFGQWSRVDGYDKRIEAVQKTVGYNDPPSGLVKSVKELAEHQRQNADTLSRIEQSINKATKGNFRSSYR